MPRLEEMDRAALESKKSEWTRAYEAVRAEGLALDMTRGKPCPEQLDLADGLLDAVRPGDAKAADGTDTRNYGGLDGLPEAKALFADYLEVGPDEIVIGGNSSLQIMHDTLASCLGHGPAGGAPWRSLPAVKWLCPCPGYDRHFTLCEHFGIEMLPVGNTPTGPAMDEVERLAAEDEAVRGIWIVPKYANPTGATCSDETVERLARMKTAAPDFRIFWDNAYNVHHLSSTPDRLANILEACKAAGNPDRVFLFGSTSKVSFAGAGIALFGGSADNVAWKKKQLFVQTIGPDKINQLRHVRFFGDMDGIRAHMEKHAAILRPKFAAVLEALERDLAELGVAAWTNPAGGYFVSLDTPDGCAKAVVARAAEAGVKLTAAGATFPYKKDPRDRNIRIAPTLPSVEEIRRAMEVLTLCVRLAAAEKHLASA